MNRLLGQQPKLNTAGSPRSPSVDSNSTRSPMSATGLKDLPGLSRARSPSVDTGRRGQSPHLIGQMISPIATRKPVLDGNSGSNNSNTAMSGRDRPNGTTLNTNTGAIEQPATATATDQGRYQFEAEPSSPTTARNPEGAGAHTMDLDPQAKLEDYDWGELEDQFQKRMEAFRAEEDGIWEEWKAWGEIFKAWASTISVHDEERASKRLRTRVAFTQGSEESLEAKRQHYIKVVQAFESALALLSSRNSAHNFI